MDVGVVDFGIGPVLVMSAMVMCMCVYIFTKSSFPKRVKGRSRK